MDKVSFIIPCFNSEKYIRRCLDSILYQPYDCIEVICIDDCSLDSTKSIILEYMKCDSRVILCENEKRMGPAFSRNNALKIASGKYIWYVDSDDYIEDNSVGELVSISNQYNTDILLFRNTDIFDGVTPYPVTRLEYQDYKDCMTGKEIFEEFSNNKLIGTATWDRLFLRDFLLSDDYRFSDFRVGTDEIFTIKTLLNAKRVMSISKSFYCYTHRNNSITTVDITLDHIKARIDIIRGLKELYVYADTDELKSLLSRHIRVRENNLRNNMTRIKGIDRELLLEQPEYLPAIMMVNDELYNHFFPIKLSPELIKKLKEKSHVYLYGAGKVGSTFEILLRENNILIDGFLVTKLQDNYDVNNVYEIHDVKPQDGVMLCIMVSNIEKQNEMKDTALVCGFSKESMILYNEICWF